MKSTHKWSSTVYAETKPFLFKNFSADSTLALSVLSVYHPLPVNEISHLPKFVYTVMRYIIEHVISSGVTTVKLSVFLKHKFVY